jgi:hypothetical protein
MTRKQESNLGFALVPFACQHSTTISSTADQNLGAVDTTHKLDQLNNAGENKLN